MSSHDHGSVSRRTLTRLALGTPLAALAGPRVARGQDEATPDVDDLLAATPSIPDEDDLTLEQTEGPYYTPDAPERIDLREDGIPGDPMTLAGYVIDREGAPVAAALVDVWHADGDGVYDNEGYKLRGHQFTDDEGRWVLQTVMPGLYPGRTRHFHVKVQAPDGPILTTQLYFPDEPANAEDGIYDEALLLSVADEPLPDEALLARFTFVIETT